MVVQMESDPNQPAVEPPVTDFVPAQRGWPRPLGEPRPWSGPPPAYHPAEQPNGNDQRSSGAARIRSFQKRDIMPVAWLHRKVFSPQGGPPSAELCAYLSDVFFDHPGYDDSSPSLVYEENDGRIAGFLGVIPGRMVMRGRPVKVAVGSQFMVDPDSRNAMAGVKLLKAFFSGPQDLSMTDGANAMARRVWETLGGSSVPIYSIYWTRVLRPAQYALALAGKPGSLLRVALMSGRPIGRMLDGTIMGRMQPYRFQAQRLPFVAEEEADIGRMCAHLSQLSANTSLRPDYDPESLTWRLRMAALKKKFGPLRNEVLRRADGEVVGWYLYYLNVGGVSQVLQLTAFPKTITGVLNHLFYSAWKLGSTAIAGRIEPRFMHELYHQRCRFNCGSAFLIQSKDQDLLQAVYTGDALLTRLEGEWWNRFNELAH